MGDLSGECFIVSEIENGTVVVIRISRRKIIWLIAYTLVKSSKVVLRDKPVVHSKY